MLTFALSLGCLSFGVLVDFNFSSRAEVLVSLGDVLTEAAGSFCLECAAGVFEVTVSTDVFRGSSELSLSFVSSLVGKSEFALLCTALGETAFRAGEPEGVTAFG